MAYPYSAGPSGQYAARNPYPPQQASAPYYAPPPPTHTHNSYLAPTHGHGHAHGHAAYPPADPFRAYYADRLRELTVNSRPLIQELSLLAMQQRDQTHWANMTTVVEEIEAAVYRSGPHEKLPKLYLLDSISKNVGAPYTTHLLPPIVPRLYVRTHREVDGVTRSKMGEVVALWRTSGPGGSELYGAPVRLEVEQQLFGAPPVPKPQSPALLPNKNQVLDAIHATIQAKHAEAAQRPWDRSVEMQLGALMGLSEMVTTRAVPPMELQQIMDQLKGMTPMPAPPARSPLPASTPQVMALPPFAPTMRSPAPPQISTPPIPSAVPTGANDISNILKGLTTSGLFAPATPTPEVVKPKTKLQGYEDMILSLDLSLSSLDLNRMTTFPLDHLPVKCSQCSHRFQAEGPALDAHMDWHVRRNRSERQPGGRGAHRRWLPRADEWVAETPSAPGAESSAMAMERADSAGVAVGANGKPMKSVEELRKKFVKVPSGGSGAGATCPVCKEAFKAEWSEDEEEWVWRNAISVNGKIYHATCRAESLVSRQRAKAAGLRGSVTGTKSPSKSMSPGRTPEPVTSAKHEPHPLSQSVSGGAEVEETAEDEEAEQETAQVEAQVVVAQPDDRPELVPVEAPVPLPTIDLSLLSSLGNFVPPLGVESAGLMGVDEKLPVPVESVEKPAVPAVHEVVASGDDEEELYGTGDGVVQDGAGKRKAEQIRHEEEAAMKRVRTDE